MLSPEKLASQIDERVAENKICIVLKHTVFSYSDSTVTMVFVSCCRVKENKMIIPNT